MVDRPVDESPVADAFQVTVFAIAFGVRVAVDTDRFASLDVAQSLAGKPGVGVVGGCEREAVTEIAGPVGGVLGLIPVTSPVAALVFKALICIKARDALIVSCHRDAAGVGARTVDLLRQVLGRHRAPADLLKSAPRRPARRATAALMRHPGVSMILATGGTAMAKAAYSSGTPAIGVGPGNAPAWVCADADAPALTDHRSRPPRCRAVYRPCRVPRTARSPA